MHISERLFARFEQWFTSRACVWQTIVVTMALVFAEWLVPSLDPHGFYLLYWLTVYSAVTQPVLAYGNARSATSTETLLRRLASLEQQQTQMLRELRWAARRMPRRSSPVRNQVRLRPANERNNP